jgi:very-short-patch-repair endonuclease
MTEAREPETTPTVHIGTGLAGTVNLAFYQNAVPLLRELAIVNDTDQHLDAVELRVASDPPFLTPKVWRVEQVGPNQCFHLTDLDLQLDGGLLARLTEAKRAQVRFALSVSGEQRGQFIQTVELLAPNEWAGITQLPELLAAFVQPNDPAVEHVLKKAAEVLRQAGKNSALNGYQDNSKARVWELASALWSAVCSLSLDYSAPPASFERTGQKVRSPGHIVDSGLATCLDLTLLFAAALEQMGLNPIVILTQGHSFTGCWLKSEELAAVAVDDVTALRKRIGLQELVVFETTLATGSNPPAFSHAVERGTVQFEPGEDEKFRLAIDIRRARRQRIRPLASDTPERVLADTAATPASAAVFEDAPPLEEESVVPIQEIPDNTPRGRLDRWQRHLLDLSLRNNLLNFKAARRALRIEAPDPAKLEDRLATGAALKIKAKPQVMQGDDPRSSRVHLQRYREDARQGLVVDTLARSELLVDLPDVELDGRLVELYRAARASLQEGGANTLFIALGFLNWKRDDKDTRRYQAPLVLIPVTLQRKSVKSDFQLVLHEDEPRFNPTLVEMLRQDFHLSLPFNEAELPKDDAGLDVRRIWRTVAEAIKDVPGWEVSEEVVLSTFSFAKHLMWKDLVDRTDQLRESPVVRHLIDTPTAAYATDLRFPDPTTLDDRLDPARTFCPLPADSSQLTAVAAAAAGKDFVLVGPPGTGKSQTISNIIAQCLAEGRTVLFVAEKTAALEVVHRRLKQVGLGEFCLELHSNKARKTDVVAQLAKAWHSRGNLDEATWQREAARLKGLRDDLNTFARRLHHRHRNGLTARTAIARLAASQELPKVPLDWPSSDAHDQVQLDHLRELAGRLEVNVDAADVNPEQPLLIVATGNWSPNWQQALLEAAGTLGSATQTLEEAAQRLSTATGLPSLPLDGQRRDGLAALARALPQAAGKDWRCFLRPDGRKLREDLEKGIRLLEARQARRGELSLAYPAEALASDVTALSTLWDRAMASRWPKNTWLRHKVRKALIKLSRILKAKPDCARDLLLFAAIRSLDQDLGQLVTLSETTGGLWNGLHSDAGEIHAALSFADTLTRGLAGVAADADTLDQARAVVERLLNEANALLEPTGSVGVAAAGYLRAFAGFHSAARRFGELAGVTDAGTVQSRTLPDLRSLARGIVDHRSALHAWCAWRRVRDEAVAAGLGSLIDAIESGTVPHKRIVETFEASYCGWWLSELVERDAVLREFVSAQHEQQIEEFRKLDDQHMQLTRDYVRARLCAELPDPNDQRRTVEWGTLRREIEKKKRHMPLRQLIDALPEALPKLAPCLLMSPLSIAQYLPAGQTRFDLVLFDEASQIPVWDAVGALARGRQAIVVGDPKQLPPTSFFDRAREQDDGDVVEEGDLESILDECLGANLPKLGLNWHYRSRHESLIAFSNHRYYQGGLVTFPSPVVEDRAVSFHSVEAGSYEKGGARTNPVEARALVADIVSRLKDQTFVDTRQSVGVVTFNAEQQRLIEDLLDRERGLDPSIEAFFADDHPEPLMVKNLENVQGDERDIMYFSVTYGPDRSGAMSMNFGPLNREGGERRLNVAVTRARNELRVFSSLLPDRIDLSRTQALGVRDFKHFLEYAIRGPRALAEATFGGVGEFESPFEAAVAAALAHRGWRVVPQVGVSSFRIDLGVVHPERPGAFLAGIECDGATYHRSATARDRDKLREQVLRGLGWNIVRVWSLDWWVDAAGTLDKIDAQLRTVLEAGQTRVETQTSQSNDPVATDVMQPSPGVGEKHEAVSLTAEPGGDAAHPPHEAATSIPDADPGTYCIADPATVAQPDPGSFFEKHYEPRLIEMIRHVIAVEGPIRGAVLARRIANAHGFQRTGSRIRDRVEQLALRFAQVTQEDAGTFYWLKDGQPGHIGGFRRPGPDAVRPVDDIAMIELIQLASEVAEKRLGSEEESVSTMARLAGLHHMRAPSRARLTQAWRAALAAGPSPPTENNTSTP